MKNTLLSLSILFVITLSGAQNSGDIEAIERTLNNYIDGFYTGDASKLRASLKPRLYKFGYLKDKQSGKYEYYEQMTFEQAIAFVNKMKQEGRSRDENSIRNVEVLDVGNSIAAAKITAAWGIDFALLSKENGRWMIEQVIWEGPYIPTKKQPTTSTYYLIRHAEKDRSNPANKNPELSAKGQQRAAKWAETFNSIPIDQVFSTNYKRTWQTAYPIAKSKNVKVQIYNPDKIDVEQFILNTKGQHILIVGHSNTTPKLANALLGEETYKMMEDDDNSGLYIITITGKDRSSTLLKIQ
jgi:phosphohistidine phosphatase SixA